MDWLGVAPGSAVNAASGIVLVALGLAVLAVRPRRRVNVALAGYCGFYGAGFIGSNLLDGNHPLAVALSVAEGACFVVASGALLYLALRFPTPAPARLLPWPAAAGALMFVLLEAIFLRGVGTEARSELQVVRATGLMLFYAVVLFAALLLLIRYARTRPDERGARRLLALFSLAITAFPAMIALRPAFDDGGWQPAAFVAFGALVLLAGAWLFAGEVAGDARPARNVAWLLLGLALVGLLMGASIGAEGAISRTAASDVGYNGLARLTGALLLAYAILRHQLLGIDVRLRWTIRRGTLAAAFLAAFVLATAVAQEFLSEEYGYVYGGVAAGALVFALSPLQRFAERIADRALPQDAARNEDAYRAALAIALDDGVLTPTEERHLARLATALGLTHERALDLREHAQRERAAQAG